MGIRNISGVRIVNAKTGAVKPVSTAIAKKTKSELFEENLAKMQPDEMYSYRGDFFSDDQLWKLLRNAGKISLGDGRELSDSQNDFHYTVDCPGRSDTGIMHLNVSWWKKKAFMVTFGYSALSMPVEVPDDTAYITNVILKVQDEEENRQITQVALCKDSSGHSIGYIPGIDKPQKTKIQVPPESVLKLQQLLRMIYLHPESVKLTEVRDW